MVRRVFLHGTNILMHVFLIVPFVSGDAAVGFSLVILYLVTNNIKYAYFSIFFGVSIGLVRIIEGGHF